MHTDEFLIEKTIKLYESNTGWGDSDEWTNQDFVVLSEKIQERTGVALSHVTLKRVWGKVKYDSIPNTHTLDTLVQFLGYESWRQFKSQNGNGAIIVEPLNRNNHNGHHAPILYPVKKNDGYLKIVIPVAIIGLAGIFLIFASKS